MHSAREDVLQQTLLAIAARCVRSLSVREFYKVLYSRPRDTQAAVAIRRALYSLCLDGFLQRSMSHQYIITEKGKDFVTRNKIRIISQGVRGRIRALDLVGKVKENEDSLRVDVSTSQEHTSHNLPSNQNDQHGIDVGQWSPKVRNWDSWRIGIWKLLMWMGIIAFIVAVSVFQSMRCINERQMELAVSEAEASLKFAEESYEKAKSLEYDAQQALKRNFVLPMELS